MDASANKPATPSPGAESSPSSTPLISDTERLRRQRAHEEARASVFLEGFTLSEREQARARQYIAGEISDAQYFNPVDILTHNS